MWKHNTVDWVSGILEYNTWKSLPWNQAQGFIMNYLRNNGRLTGFEGCLKKLGHTGRMIDLLGRLWLWFGLITGLVGSNITVPLAWSSFVFVLMY